MTENKTLHHCMPCMSLKVSLPRIQQRPLSVSATAMLVAGSCACAWAVRVGLPRSCPRCLMACVLRLLQVCCAAGQAWVEDPSNATPVYLRNRVRAVLQDPHSGEHAFSSTGVPTPILGRL